MPSSDAPSWAIRPLVPIEVYTDREEHLEYLYQAALKAITRRSMSTVMLGQRRMGKTEIFKRVVNRLFFDQDNYADRHASVVPVYYSFPDMHKDRWDFSEQYVLNFMRWVTAFRLRRSDLLTQKNLKINELIELIQRHPALTVELQGALNVLDAILEKDIAGPEEWALWLPRRTSDHHEGSVVMFLDEFQNTRLPQFGFDIVGLMQEAVESPTCPHFVTGSAMSILAGEILGRGALFGRFESEPIGPMTDYWGAELALKCARYYQATLPEEMAPVVSARCGGNPFYIMAVVRQAVKQNKLLLDETRINEILAVDLSSGFIWGELNEQVGRWIERVNVHGITKWVLYLSALEEGDRIDLTRIQTELKAREGSHVSLETIRDILIKLSRGDLLEFMELGNWFRKVSDPILLEFLKVWGRIAVEGRRAQDVQNDLRFQYGRLKRQIADHRGYIAELYMAQILWNSQNQSLPGRYLHADQDIPVNWLFSYIRHRVRLGPAKDMEIDVYAAAGSEVWLCESKWWRQNRKAGVTEVQSLLKKARWVREDLGEGLEILRLWFFAYSGFTDEAESLMRAEGVLWSDRQDLDGLLAHVGLKWLPEV